jgi:hypothetical protein
MVAARIFDGAAWTDITDSDAGHTGNHAPVAPILDGDGNIFVSIPSFRGVLLLFDWWKMTKGQYELVLIPCFFFFFHDML